MSEQVERLLAQYIEQENLSRVEPLKAKHAAEKVGTNEWWFTLHDLQVAEAEIQGMKIALSFIEGVHYAQTA